MKPCKICWAKKSVDEFTKYPGRTNICNVCDRKRQNKNSRNYRRRKRGFKGVDERRVVSFDQISKTLKLSFNEVRKNYLTGMAKLRDNPDAAALLGLLQQGPDRALGGRESSTEL